MYRRSSCCSWPCCVCVCGSPLQRSFGNSKPDQPTNKSTNKSNAQNSEGPEAAKNKQRSRIHSLPLTWKPARGSLYKEGSRIHHGSPPPRLDPAQRYPQPEARGLIRLAGGLEHSSPHKNQGFKSPKIVGTPEYLDIQSHSYSILKELAIVVPPHSSAKQTLQEQA